MQSVIQKKSYGSVKTFWLNRELLDIKLNQAVKKMLSEKKEVEKVVLFGSFAGGKASVSSDIDILLVVKRTDKKFIDRQLDYRDYFDDIGLKVDLFVYTNEEAKKDIPIIKEALTKGICLTY